jgi:hypothetical protein
VAAVGVLGDVQAMEHQLAVVLLDERVDQRRVAGAQGFHLVADQDDPGLVCLEDRVVVPGPPVRGDEPAAWLSGRGALLVIQSVHPPGGAGHAAAWAGIQNVPGERLGELLLLIGPGRRRRRGRAACVKSGRCGRRLSDRRRRGWLLVAGSSWRWPLMPGLVPPETPDG